MKQFIRKWLGLDKDFAYLERLAVEAGKPKKSNPYEEQYVYELSQIVSSICNHLDLDIKNELVPDPSRMREPEPMVKRYAVVPRNRKKK